MRVLFCLLIALPWIASAAEKPNKVIYGRDNRRDIYDASEAHRLWARSTAAFMYPEHLKPSPDGLLLIQAPTLQQKERLCPGEAFLHQPAPAFCSATLITSKHLLTAGHCAESAFQCLQTQVVFDFVVNKPQSFPQAVAKEQVYHCQKIIYSQSDEYGADFAILELDREVTDRGALSLGSSYHLKADDRLVIISYPSGIPAKIDAGGRFRESPGTPLYYRASLDTFGGSSGAGVLDARTGLITGVLVRGEDDYVRKQDCFSSVRCYESNCRGEDVTRIEKVLEVFNPGSIKNP